MGPSHRNHKFLYKKDTGRARVREGDVRIEAEVGVMEGRGTAATEYRRPLDAEGEGMNFPLSPQMDQPS